jgi:hypothetical protein
VRHAEVAAAARALQAPFLRFPITTTSLKGTTMFNITSIAVGAAGVGFAYFLYLAATKGLPAALAWAKAKWNSAGAEVTALRADLAQLEQGAVADVKSRLATLEADVASLKKPAAPAPAAAPVAAAPAFVTAAAPQAPAPAA